MPKKRLKTHSARSLYNLRVHEDEHLLIINKPKGISTIPERSGSEYNMLSLLREKFPELSVVHRLDKYTTGLLIFAKTGESFHRMTNKFKQQEIEKVYVALCEGVHFFEENLIKVGVEVKSAKTHIHWQGKEGRLAITELKTLRQFGHYSLVQARPKTGRVHQIRSLLAFLGAPIVGDTKYGGGPLLLSQLKKKYKGTENPQGLNIGYLLHAWKLRFEHPFEKKEINIEAPFSKNFQACLNILERYDSELESLKK